MHNCASCGLSLDLVALDRRARLLREEAHAEDHLLESRVLGQALLPAVVDLLRDDRGLEQAVRVIEDEARRRAARALEVARGDLGARHHAGARGRAEWELVVCGWVARLRPVGQR